MNKLSVILLSAAIAGSGLLSAAEVDQRLENQKDRVQQGVASGELTHKEAKDLRTDEKAIHNEVKEERKENGGKLTPAERRAAKRKLARESKKIYRKKHNEAERPDAK
jgi:hypothetical protein